MAIGSIMVAVGHVLPGVPLASYAGSSSALPVVCSDPNWALQLKHLGPQEQSSISTSERSELIVSPL